MTRTELLMVLTTIRLGDRLEQQEFDFMGALQGAYNDAIAVEAFVTDGQRRREENR